MDKNLFVLTFQKDLRKTIDDIMNSNISVYIVFIFYPIIALAYVARVIHKQFSWFIQHGVKESITQTTNYIRNINQKIDHIKSSVQQIRSVQSSQFKIVKSAAHKKARAIKWVNNIQDYKTFDELAAVIETLDTMRQLLDIMCNKYENYEINQQNQVLINSIQLFKKIGKRASPTLNSCSLLVRLHSPSQPACKLFPAVFEGGGIAEYTRWPTTCTSVCRPTHPPTRKHLGTRPVLREPGQELLDLA